MNTYSKITKDYDPYFKDINQKISDLEVIKRLKVQNKELGHELGSRIER